MRASQLYFVSLALSSLLWISFASACSGTPSKGTSAARPGQSEQGDDKSTQDGADGDVGFASGGERACMLHEQAGGYFRCLSGSDGQCFHYGSACTPGSTCMYDASAQQHKICEESQAGTCLRYGQPCTPEASCMFNQDDNRYRQCAEVVDGKCESFGEACQPAA